MTWRFDGADLAHYQDEAGALIDWAALRGGSPGSYVATKATQRNNYVDLTFGVHRMQMAAHDFELRGLYHWLSPTTEASTVSQIAHIERTIGTFQVGEFFMLDAEQGGCLMEDAAVVLEGIESMTGRPSVVYTGIYVDGGRMWLADRIRNSKYGPRAMHLAAYLTEERLQQILVQRGIQNLERHANQYSSNGPVPGVTGRCDMNQINNRSVFRACAGYTSVQPPTETDMTIVLTNQERRSLPGIGDIDPLGIKYELVMDGDFPNQRGTKRRLTYEHRLLGSPVGTPLPNVSIPAQGITGLDDIPDWTPGPQPGGGSTDCKFGPMSVSVGGSLSLSGGASPT